MAEVRNLHRSPPSPPERPVFTAHQEESSQQGQQREFYHQLNPFAFDFDFELFSHPNRSSNPSFLDDYNVAAGCAREEPNCMYIAAGDDDDEEEQMNFVTDLFESRQTSLVEDPIWEREEASAPEFGFGPGLRVVDMDSESDSEEFEVNSGFLDNNYDDDYDGYGINSNSYYHSNENQRDEFEWEEVSERIHSDEGENLSSLINRIDEISVSSDASDDSEAGNSSTLGDDEVAELELQSIEWEVLLAVNNLERELENLAGSRSSGGAMIPGINLPEDYILAVEYDALFGALVENESAAKGSPPAAKSAVDSLPSVVVTKEEVGGKNGGVVCAVCKDEFVVGEKATRMPCGHRYHGGCILPWLSIRNTCPVCRHELPTDDAEYEQRRGRRDGRGVNDLLADELEARYNFELLP